MQNKQRADPGRGLPRAIPERSDPASRVRKPYQVHEENYTLTA